MPIQTPFKPIHDRLGANYAEYDGWSLPADFGDLQAENHALRSESAVFDLSSFARITLKGPDAAKLIDFLTPTNLHNLSNDKWLWAIICDENGYLVDIVRIAQTSGTYQILASPHKRLPILNLATKTAASANLENVQIIDTTEKTGMLGLYGPKAVETLDRILPFNITEIAPGAVKTMTFFMISVTIIRGTWLGLDGIELICPLGAAAMAAGALARYRDREKITPAGIKTLDSAITESSLPFAITRHSDCNKIGPAALGLSNLIDLDKDFLGKDAIAKQFAQGPKTALMGLKTAKIGTEHTNLKVQYDDRHIGSAEKMIPSGYFNCNIAMAMIETEFCDLTDEVQIVGDDIVSGAELVKLPFDKNSAAGFYNQ